MPWLQSLTSEKSTLSSGFKALVLRFFMVLGFATQFSVEGLGFRGRVLGPSGIFRTSIRPKGLAKCRCCRFKFEGRKSCTVINP